METQIRNNMKAFLLIVIHFFFLNVAYSGTCSSISRTNFSANQVLTSTALNSQFNTVYNAANALDAGCLTDGTLEFSALNTSEFAPILDGVQRGCKVEYSDSNTVTISRCYATVNGNAVAKTSSTSATWGCSGCSSESASQAYYVYIKDGSTGSTITPLISTTAPNADGYDGSNNFVVGRFYNNGSSDIDQYSIDQWSVNRFIPQETGWVEYTPTVTGGGTVSNMDMWFKRVGGDIVIMGLFNAGTVDGTTATVTLPTGLAYGESLTTNGNFRYIGNFYYGTNSSGADENCIIYDAANDDLRFGNSSGSYNCRVALAGNVVWQSSNPVSIKTNPLPIANWSY